MDVKKKVYSIDTRMQPPLTWVMFLAARVLCTMT
jgi:hypothetical protein